MKTFVSAILTLCVFCYTSQYNDMNVLNSDVDDVPVIDTGTNAECDLRDDFSD